MRRSVELGQKLMCVAEALRLSVVAVGVGECIQQGYCGQRR